MDSILNYSNPEFSEMKIKSNGIWKENQKVQVEYINSKNEAIVVLRRVYFDSHDLYITIQGKRYYYSEFN